MKQPRFLPWRKLYHRYKLRPSPAEFDPGEQEAGEKLDVGEEDQVAGEEHEAAEDQSPPLLPHPYLITSSYCPRENPLHWILTYVDSQYDNNNKQQVFLRNCISSNFTCTPAVLPAAPPPLPPHCPPLAAAAAAWPGCSRHRCLAGCYCSGCLAGQVLVAEVLFTSSSCTTWHRILVLVVIK